MGGGRSTKKYSPKGKLNEKNHARQFILKKYSCYGVKKNSYKEFDNQKKIPAARKFPSPPPPITFLMVRCPLIGQGSLIVLLVNGKKQVISRLKNTSPKNSLESL